MVRLNVIPAFVAGADWPVRRDRLRVMRLVMSVIAAQVTGDSECWMSGS
ncbi:hypothetical protein ACIQ7D_30830 [Streptomyces sp. NPDC096310]